MPARLRPATTLAQIHGRERVFLLRASFAEPGWRPTEPGMRDMLAGTPLGVAGPMGLVASSATVTDAGLRLLERAGLPVAARLHAYRTRAEYLAILRRVSLTPRSAAVQYVHTKAELAPSACQVPPTLLRNLNDKGNLADYVAAYDLPRRFVHERDALPPPARLLREGPVVLKVATRKPTGGGLCVFVCRTPRDVARATAAAGRGDRIVVEEWLEIARSLCVQYAVHEDGAIRYLGTTEQICTPAGRYGGNWLDSVRLADDPRAKAAALPAVRRGAEQGYRGVVGVDVAITREDQVRVLDLNFRLNGSTPALLLQRALAARGTPVARYGAWTARVGSDRFFGAVGDLVEEGVLLPLATYDPRAGSEGHRLLMAGLVLGRTREEVRREEARLTRLGLS